MSKLCILFIIIQKFVQKFNFSLNLNFWPKFAAQTRDRKKPWSNKDVHQNRCSNFSVVAGMLDLPNISPFHIPYLSVCTERMPVVLHDGMNIVRLSKAVPF